MNIPYISRLNRALGVILIPATVLSAGCVRYSSSWRPEGSAYDLRAPEKATTKTQDSLEIGKISASLDDMMIQVPVTASESSVKVIPLDSAVTERQYQKKTKMSKLAMGGCLFGLACIGGAFGAKSYYDSNDMQSDGNLFMGVTGGLGVLFIANSLGFGFNKEEKATGQTRQVIVATGVKTEEEFAGTVYSGRPIEDIPVMLFSEDFGFQNDEVLTDIRGVSTFRIERIPNYWSKSLVSLERAINGMDGLSSIKDKSIRKEYMESLIAKAKRCSYKIQFKTEKDGYTNCESSVDITGFGVSDNDVKASFSALVDQYVNTKIVNLEIECTQGLGRGVADADVNVVSAAPPPSAFADMLFTGALRDEAVKLINPYTINTYAGKSGKDGKVSVPVIKGYAVRIEAKNSPEGSAIMQLDDINKTSVQLYLRK